MTKVSKPEYLVKVAKLSKLEKDRLMSRMSGKLPRRLEKDKLSNDEALAIQLELEDEQLQEWRKMMTIIRDKEKAKLAAQEKEAAPKTSKKKKETKREANIEDIAPSKIKSTGKKKTNK
jgi:hypothetical protein